MSPPDVEDDGAAIDLRDPPVCEACINEGGSKLPEGESKAPLNDADQDFNPHPDVQSEAIKLGSAILHEMRKHKDTKRTSRAKRRPAVSNPQPPNSLGYTSDAKSRQPVRQSTRFMSQVASTGSHDSPPKFPERTPSAPLSPFPFFQNPRLPLVPAKDSSWGVSDPEAKSPSWPSSPQAALQSNEYKERFDPTGTKPSQGSMEAIICPICEEPISLRTSEIRFQPTRAKSTHKPSPELPDNSSTLMSRRLRTIPLGIVSIPSGGNLYHTKCIRCRVCRVYFQPGESSWDWVFLGSGSPYHRTCVTDTAKPMLKRLRKIMSLNSLEPSKPPSLVSTASDENESTAKFGNLDVQNFEQNGSAVSDKRPSGRPRAPVASLVASTRPSSLYVNPQSSRSFSNLDPGRDITDTAEPDEQFQDKTKRKSRPSTNQEALIAAILDKELKNIKDKRPSPPKDRLSPAKGSFVASPEELSPSPESAEQPTGGSPEPPPPTLTRQPTIQINSPRGRREEIYDPLTSTQRSHLNHHKRRHQARAQQQQGDPALGPSLSSTVTGLSFTEQRNNDKSWIKAGPQKQREDAKRVRDKRRQVLKGRDVRGSDRTPSMGAGEQVPVAVARYMKGQETDSPLGRGSHEEMVMPRLKAKGKERAAD